MRLLKPVATTANSWTLQLNGGGGDIITIHCDDAHEDARKIARAVNLFDALVGALALFRSSEMGGLLVDMIDMREANGEQTQKRLSRLIDVIDVILDAAEPAEESANADADND